MGDMEFAKAHNSTIFLEDPPATHSDLKFIVDGLNKSCLVHYLTTNPAIYQSLIKDLWRNAGVKKNDRGEKFLETTIEDKKILVTKSIIKKSLQIEDRPEYPLEIDVHQIEEILEHMGYEGTFPHTIKKLLPPCWKLLAHMFVSCISGWRSGANEISLANTGAIATSAAEDVREESADQSMPMENEDISLFPSEPEVEEIHHSPAACVADEHDYKKANDSKSSRGDDDDDLYEDVEFLKEIDFIGINDDIPTNIEFDFGDKDFDPFIDIPSSRVNKTSQTSIRTRQSLESLEVPSIKCAPQVISTITATTAHSPSKQTDEGPSTMFETGGSSSIPGYSPT
ncbi:unnamed protein product [Lactuca saligna]|uniref:Uncharacterized protein n=1 Tax=Lactuca saligna TaxID=75948 RepID=A0AA35ZDU5_LACSI|nr:unnamed protein product [Lactuca saligna]